MNTRHIWMGAAAIVVAFSGGVAAQSTSSSAKSIQQGKDITVTGCLQTADPSGSAPTGSARPGAAAGVSPGTSKSSPSSANADRFMLTNTTSGGSASAAKNDSSAAGATGSTYMLEGKTAELRPHLNHQIEISGRILSSSGSSSSSSSVGVARLNVQSVRMISATCPK